MKWVSKEEILSLFHGPSGILQISKFPKNENFDYFDIDVLSQPNLQDMIVFGKDLSKLLGKKYKIFIPTEKASSDFKRYPVMVFNTEVIEDMEPIYMAAKHLKGAGRFKMFQFSEIQELIKEMGNEVENGN